MATSFLKCRNLLSGAIMLIVQSFANAQCIEGWLDGDGYPGLDGQVFATTVWDADGAGPQAAILVFGGNFTTAGEIFAKNIVGWDGSNWVTFGDGMNFSVTALSVYEGDLIAGGNFSLAGQTSANFVARWDGVQWQAMSNGVSTPVSAIVNHNGSLILAHNHGQMKMWIGSEWAAIPGMNNGVSALVSSGNDVLAIGTFATAGGIEARRVARWNGVAWSAIGNGIPQTGVTLNTLCIHNNLIYVAGSINTQNGPIGYVSRWNGTQWEVVTNGLNGPVLCLTIHEGDLYAGGLFTQSNLGPVKYLARWSGSNWQQLSGQIDLPVAHLDFFNQSLHACTEPKSVIKQLTGNEWRVIWPNGINNSVRRLFWWIDRFIAGGSFTQIDGEHEIAHVAEWTGSEWRSFAPGLNGLVTSFAAHNDSLVAGGTFAGLVARWNGDTWERFGGPLGFGMSSTVYDLCIHQGDLYACGSFQNIDGTISGIARWDGTQWHRVGDGVSGVVHAMTVFNGELIAGGAFFVEGVPHNNIMRWDGTAWHSFGGHTNISVLCLHAHDGSLYAGGIFTLIAGQPANRIARWDGVSWNPLGSGMSSDNASVGMLCDYRGQLVAGGVFQVAGGIAAQGLARWDGASWHAFGKGIEVSENEYPMTVATIDDELVIGGSFQRASGNRSAHFARWTDTNIPWISTYGHPLDVNIGCKSSAVFAVVPASGYDNLSYQWQRHGEPLTDGTNKHGSIISGAHTNTLTITNPNEADEGAYDVVVSNECGSVTSNAATLTVQRCGDITGDGVVNVADLLAVISAWGACPPAPASCAADIHPPPNGNGVVNVGDLLQVITNWG